METILRGNERSQRFIWIDICKSKSFDYLCGKIPTFLTFTTFRSMKNSQEKQIFGVVRIGDKGQIVIPKEAREAFGLKPNDTLLVLGDITKGIALVKTKVFDDVVEDVFK